MDGESGGFGSPSDGDNSDMRWPSAALGPPPGRPVEGVVRTCRAGVGTRAAAEAIDRDLESLAFVDGWQPCSTQAEGDRQTEEDTDMVVLRDPAPQTLAGDTGRAKSDVSCPLPWPR